VNAVCAGVAVGELGALCEPCAAAAITDLHWRLPVETGEGTRDFGAIVDFKFAPNPTQQAAIDRAADMHAPGLTIIESPMGEGKTEAALYLMEYAGRVLGAPGCYVALPTQATSNQMFSRVREFLERRFSGQTVTLQLLHGHSALSAELQAMLRDDPDEMVPDHICDDDPRSDAHEREQAEVIAGEWFTARKRGLLAPFGVGTVDQALLAVLPTKHQFVRLGALAGKVVIFDEVHAYDAYMSIILECLLTWLAALGSPVLLLSATLPGARRDALLRAYARGLHADLPAPIAAQPYPRISWVTAAEAGAAPIAASERSTRSLGVSFVDGAITPGGGDFALAGGLRFRVRFDAGHGSMLLFEPSLRRGPRVGCCSM